MGCTQARKIAILAVAGLMLGVGAGCQEDDTGALRTIIGDGLAPTGPMDPCMRAEDEDRLISEMLEQINRERRRRSLPVVKRNETLDRIAEFYACRMIDGGFFSHVDPDDDSHIDSRAGDFGYAFQKLGENLGAGQYSVDRVMREWMRSPGHRANLLDPEFTEVGLAVRVGGEHGVYWVQEFGRPLTSRPIGETPMEEMKPVPATSQPAAQGESTDDTTAHADPAPQDADLGEPTAYADPFFADDWHAVMAMFGAM